jgi:hypothetical protein
VSEFMFRNLSVKLFPSGTDGPAGAGGSPDPPIFQCVPCSQLSAVTLVGCIPCTQTPTPLVVCNPGTGFPRYCQGTSTPCDGSHFPGAGGDRGNLVFPAFAQSHEQLAQLRSQLQQSLAVVEAQQQEIEKAAKPRTVEEIDNLRSQLLGAVAELDAQRAQMTGEQPPASG